MRNQILNKKGSAVTDIVIFAIVLVFMIFPIFAAVIEKYVILTKAQTIKDSIDMTNISAYNAMKITDTGKTVVVPAQSEALDIYKSLLAENLNLNEDLTPAAGSVAEGPVKVESLIVYSGAFPVTCPYGKIINRVAVHSVVIVPVKPSLYRGLILQALGRDYVELVIHVDSEIPVNK